MNREQRREGGYIILFACLAGFLVAGVCAGEGREGRSEFALMGSSLGGVTRTFQGADITEDDWLLYGLSIGWNATDHWNINTDFSYGTIDFAGTKESYPVTGEQKTMLWMLNADYNILTYPLTPFVTGGAGFGYTSVDATQFSFGGGVIGQTSETSSGFAYNVGVGGRWNISYNVFFKVLYRIVWDSEGDQREGFVVSLGWLF